MKKFDTEDEAIAQAEKENAEHSKDFCPMINTMCKKNCVCYFPARASKCYFTTKTVVIEGCCNYYMLNGPN